METVIVVTPELARSLKEHLITGEAQAVASIVSDYGGTLVPLTEQPTSTRTNNYFIVTGAQEYNLQRLANRVRALDGVQSVYLKPNASLP